MKIKEIPKELNDQDKYIIKFEITLEHKNELHDLWYRLCLSIHDIKNSFTNNEMKSEYYPPMTIGYIDKLWQYINNKWKESYNIKNDFEIKYECKNICGKTNNKHACCYTCEYLPTCNETCESYLKVSAQNCEFLHKIIHVKCRY